MITVVYMEESINNDCVYPVPIKKNLIYIYQKIYIYNL
jgi:hypothetical protein